MAGQFIRRKQRRHHQEHDPIRAEHERKAEQREAAALIGLETTELTQAGFCNAGTVRQSLRIIT